MENCSNKQELITLYKNQYSSEFYRPFLELALTKLGNLNENNPAKLTEDQTLGIQEKLSENSFIKQTFLDGLELLSFDQINYVGW